MSFAVDANILVYASDQDSKVHHAAAEFLRRCAEGTEIFCLAWVTISAYLRIVTHPAVFRRPLSPEEAMANLIARPQTRVLGEEEGFWATYRELAARIVPRGNLVPDTHLAAVLRQHGVATLYTRDRDFLRFEFLDVVDPLESAARDRRRRRAPRASKL
ncbi:MAG: PIN domain-containing protein [Gammaproteobacteria bacterium]|nr:PIN domain-containing protein [Gammaproteobacteria bacterium]